jgi:hypothetical protein
MSPYGPSRHFAATRRFGRFRREADIDGFWRELHMLRLTHLYGPAVCCKSEVTNGDVWSCASVSGP